MRNAKKIVIVDYGVGNLFSLIRAFQFFDTNTVVSSDPDQLKKADALILPGVGSFESGIRGLESRNLSNAIKEAAHNSKLILGICLGAQLLLSEGHEFGIFQGLDIIKGKVVPFPPLPKSEKIPHIGWNNISPISTDSWNGTILDSLTKKDQVYFVHSYILRPDREENILAISEYGDYNFCSVIRENNIYGCQFHPEKSGKTGLKIIKNFLDII